MKTPETQQIVDAVVDEFGSRVRVGAWNCRPIAGTLIWSQHAYTENPETGVIYEGNAADIFPTNLLVGDQVHGFIQRNYPDTVAHLLWRVKNHFDHVHVDTWPQGYGTPPCRGGSLRVQHRDGSIGRTFYVGDDLPLNDDDKAWIRDTIASVVQTELDEKLGKTIAIPGEPTRLTTQGIVNAWHALTRSAEPASKIYQRIEAIYDKTKGL